MLGEPAFVRRGRAHLEPDPVAGARRPCSRGRDDGRRASPVRHRAAFLARREHPAVRVARPRRPRRAVGAVHALGWVPALFLPSPLGVLAELGDMARSGELSVHVAASLERLLARLRHRRRGGRRGGRRGRLLLARRGAGTPLIAATFPIPKIALLPLLILWLGIGEASKVAVIALGVFFPMAINTYDRRARRPTRCSCAPPWPSAPGGGA